MKLPFLSPNPEFMVDPLGAGDARALAAIHREDFVRPWSGGEFEALLAQDAVFGFAARQVGNAASGPVGFVLARLAADEAEILTVAVLRAFRRMGLGRELMEAVLRELHANRASTLFLEVDEANRAAIALYRRLWFGEVGRRPAYYDRPDGSAATALIMRRDMRPAPEGAGRRRT